MAKCPICNVESRPRSDNAAFPFCSSRCKSIDLGNWLNEAYRIPVEDPDPEDLEAAERAADSGTKPPGDVRH